MGDPAELQPRKGLCGGAQILHYASLTQVKLPSPFIIITKLWVTVIFWLYNIILLMCPFALLVQYGLFILMLLFSSSCFSFLWLCSWWMDRVISWISGETVLSIPSLGSYFTWSQVRNWGHWFLVGRLNDYLIYQISLGWVMGFSIDQSSDDRILYDRMNFLFRLIS